MYSRLTELTTPLRIFPMNRRLRSPGFLEVLAEEGPASEAQMVRSC